MKTIIITGCSWACGEWDTVNGHYGLSHQGLTQYYLDAGYNCINLAQPGGNIMGLWYTLNAFLKVNTHLDIKQVIYIQTDCGRSFKNLELNALLQDKSKSLTGIIDYCYQIFYDKLNDIAPTYNTKVSVVGGLTDVTTDLTPYTNLDLAVPSWVRLIDPAQPLTSLVDQTSIDFLTQHCPHRKSEILDLLDAALARRDYFDQNPKIFYPDWRHPNRYGHQILYDKLTNV